jgi:uncharacterized membrane protein
MLRLDTDLSRWPLWSLLKKGVIWFAALVVPWMVLAWVVFLFRVFSGLLCPVGLWDYLRYGGAWLHESIIIGSLLGSLSAQRRCMQDITARQTRLRKIGIVVLICSRIIWVLVLVTHVVWLGLLYMVSCSDRYS